jgi:uncharacterized protein YmfQ (DUF2313 family)
MDVAEDYLSALQGLFPSGPAWPKDDTAPVTRLFGGLAVEFSRLDSRADTLVDEADPRTTYEMLPDWERIAGLSGGSLSVAQRQSDLVSKLVSRGGQTPAYYVAMGAALGLAVTITEFREWSFDMDDDQILYGSDWAFAWQVNIPYVTSSPAIEWTFDSDDDMPFAIYSNVLDVSSFIREKPSHTTVLFAYN